MSASRLAAVLIARNEARCIVRCLQSVTPWVDRIVVLDTGSSDATPALAAQCGAQVHHLPWPDDFGAARNHALELADADWNLILDADEWVSSGGDLLRSWIEAPPRLGRIAIRSTFDDGHETREDIGWITRVLPRGVRFEGRIHEQVVSPLPREKLALKLDHDGYRDVQLNAKRDRNRTLLLVELQSRPEDPYLLYQLGKETEGDQAWAEAADLYRRALARTRRNDAWFHDLLVRRIHTLGQSGDLAAALDLAAREGESLPDSPDLFFVFGNLLLDQAAMNPGEAEDRWLPLALSAWERCLQIGDQPELEGSVKGRGSHLAQHNLDLVRSHLARLNPA